MERMKKRILIALALCMALGTASAREVEEEKTLRSVEVTTVGKRILQANFPIPVRQPREGGFRCAYRSRQGAELQL